MIVASLLLIAAAAVLLVLGLLRDIDLLLVLSIAVSLVAAVALYLGARQARTADPAEDDDRPGTAGSVPDGSESAGHESAVADRAGSAAMAGGSGRRERPEWPLERRPATDAGDVDHDGTPADRNPMARSALAQREDAGAGAVGEEASDAPGDEPPTQRTPRSDAELIARLPAEVLVVDGRPRYHVTGCPHLLDREAEPLPVSEAAELGFSPCGWCQPDTVLLGGTPES